MSGLIDVFLDLTQDELTFADILDVFLEYGRHRYFAFNSSDGVHTYDSVCSEDIP